MTSDKKLLFLGKIKYIKKMLSTSSWDIGAQIT